MSQFKTPLRVELQPEGGEPKWALIAPLIYSSDVMGCEIVVPATFITDFVSFEPLKNVGHRAAVVHDYLYSCGDVDRKVADQVLKEALEVVGVDALLADSMYDAVRLFGGGHKENLYQFHKGA